MSRERFAKVLNTHSDRAMEEAGQSSMFGGTLSASDLLDGVAAHVARGSELASSSTAPANSRINAGGFVGEDRNAASGFADDPGRQGAAVGSAGERSVIKAAPLTPNFDTAAAERYATARAATRERYATFRNAPGVGAILKEGRFSGEFAPSAALPL